MLRFLPPLFALLASLIPLVSAATPPRDDLVMLTHFLPQHLNPLVQGPSMVYSVTPQLFASPLRFDAEGKAQPYLAERWELSEDGLAATLHLRENARFHDGTPITSADLAFSLLALRDNHPYKTLYGSVAGVETPDPHTAIIRLRHPFPALELLLSPVYCPVLPKHLFGDGRPLRDHPANLAPVGSGPFRLEEFVPGKRLLLKRDPGFFLPGRPYLERLEIRPVGMEWDVSLLLRHGQGDLAGFIFGGLKGYAELATDPRFVLTRCGDPVFSVTTSLLFNLNHKPYDDIRVRRAIAMALDREQLLQVLTPGRDRVALGPVPDTSPLYTPLEDPNRFDSAAANALLDEAGFPRGEDGIRFRVTLDYQPLDEGLLWFAQILRLALQEQLGIEVQLRNAPTMKEWAGRLATGDFDLNFWALFYQGDPITGIHRTYHSSTVDDGIPFTNDMGYRSAAADDLLERAARETDLVQRRELYRQFQQLLLRDVPSVTLNWVVEETAHHRDLLGLESSSWGLFAPFDELRWK
jgi:peptide/nickel transport system substrate-binding protein